MVWDTVGLFVTTITVNTYTIFINVKESYRAARCLVVRIQFVGSVPF
jgi:hypothetical protein